MAMNKICEVLQICTGKEVCRPDFTLQEIMENYMKVIKLAYSMFANLEQMQDKLDTWCTKPLHQYGVGSWVIQCNKCGV